VDVFFNIRHFSLLTFMTSVSFMSFSAHAERPADQIYNTYCVACHASGVANAPKFGSKADWLPHAEKGLDTLLLNATKGINAMPPKGLCFDCSDDEMQNTIQYMIDSSQGN
jgi:cytochrome c5